MYAQKPKKSKIMATLKDLCSSVPQSLLRVQTDYNVNQRKQASYNKRMERLDMERAIFEQCKRERTQKRVRNRFSTEQAGACSLTTSTRRFATSQTFVEKRGTSVRTYTLTSYTNVVCKSYSNKY
jgi:NADPH-dependent ferric siderophore reductase